MGSKITITDLVTAKSENRKFVTVSCYDHTTAKLTSQTDTEMVLAGDSAAQVLFGLDSTPLATEASEAYLDVIKAVSDAGIAVMAHFGIRPQTISKLGRFKAEATTAEMALELIALAGRFPDDPHSYYMKSGKFQRLQELLKGKS